MKEHKKEDNKKIIIAAISALAAAIFGSLVGGFIQLKISQRDETLKKEEQVLKLVEIFHQDFFGKDINQRKIYGLQLIGTYDQELAKLISKSMLETSSKKEILQKKLDTTGIGLPKISEIFESIQGYVVVLASYKNIQNAKRGVKILSMQNIGEVKLFYAINDYYAAVIGIIRSRKIALQRLEKIKQKIPDAYIYTSWAFPYEIK